jgi:general secretion pathway protein F
MSAVSFQYRAVDGEGTVRHGQMTCSSQGIVLDALHRQGWTPIEIAIASRRETKASWSWNWRGLLKEPTQASPRDLLILIQSLAVLLGAGLAIDRALQINAAMSGNPAARRLNDSLLKSVRSGHTLSAAFVASGQKLPHFARSMIEAGEIGGVLHQTLSRIAELSERQLEIKERVRSALVYPAMLAAVVLLTLVLLMTFVLPRFEVLFAESEQTLPWSTMAVLATGRFVGNYWWGLAGGLCAIAGGFYRWLCASAGRRRFDAWTLGTRVTFGLPLALNTARFLRTLSTLCQNGAPLPAALRIARGTLTNRCLHDSLAGIIDAVQSGSTFSQALAKTNLFPAVAVQLARVGEESGQLETLLLSCAKVLEEDSQRKLERLLALLVPALTIGMGVIVAALIGSVLIGLLSINDLAF